MSHLRGATTAYDISGSPVSLQFRWAKVDSKDARCRPYDTGTCSIKWIPTPRAAIAWQTSHNFTFGPTPDESDVASITLTNPTIRGVALAT